MQRWADTAHQVMGQGSDGERAAGLHVPYPSPHGVVTAGARTVARPVVNALTERSLQRAEKAARRKALRAKLPPVDTSGTGDALGGAGAEGAIVSGQQDH
jgi:hypothetical protein